MKTLKLFNYEKQKDTFFINRINDLLKTNFKEDDLYIKNSLMNILRKLTAYNYIKNDEIASELLGEFIVFMEEHQNQIRH